MKWPFRRRGVVPVTVRAEEPSSGGSRIWTVPAFCATEVKHVLPVPRGACPVSGNPLSGTASVTYCPDEHTLEVVSLLNALTWACSSRAPGSPKSVEELADWLADQAFHAVNVAVTVELDLQVRPGPQRLIVRRDRRFP